MRPTHAIARSLVAPMFIRGGLDALRFAEPAGVADEGAPFGLSDRSLLRVNGGLQLLAGGLLSVGRVPRTASAALALSLVPTTLARHRFWNETDPRVRSEQRLQFMKNAAVLGGLLLAAVDTGGAPSLAWRAKRAGAATASALSSFAAGVGDAVGVTDHASPSLHGSLGEMVAERAAQVGDRVSGVAGPLVERVHSTLPTLEDASEALETVGETLVAAGGAVADWAGGLITSIGSSVPDQRALRRLLAGR